ncbi:glycoside hydrolase family 3 N-terminal domain-containing protein [Saccharopolyspora rectivirgula]|jgi:beta-glucosidase|uniref:glycoside hydrolase family 3 N-terminal domain-containing protein n=1 Tax=Saccharopolyspora rectivirgula TaxID=28042 RepID=UPI002409EEF0|nr:glycoside hydrolase family 3 N-terminal domain-containing protein [Saccharopolyspora rectivirgula]
MGTSGITRRAVLAGMGGTIAAIAMTSKALASQKPADPAIEARIQRLLKQMTIEEKFGQLQQLSGNGDTGPGDGQMKEIVDRTRAGRLGSVLNVYGAKSSNDLQRIAVEESRLGIPLLFGFDIIHGFWTTFPIPIAQSASFDPSVAARDAEISSAEGRSNGVHWTFAPMMDVTHDPRWGRIAESGSEDPYLTARFAAAKTAAHQGNDLSAPDRVAACAKHFVAYGGAEGGRDYNTVDVSEARLRNLYLPPFKAAVEAGVATVMASFNTISGVPAHGNHHTMTEILKQQWGFTGFVVSDYNGVQEMVPHHFAEDKADAARLALQAGVDMEMVSTTINDHGPELLASGQISMRRLDDAVARILRLKFELGLFEQPYVDENAAITEPTAEARAAARNAAARCAVLLKNDGGVLPLARSARSVALVGPFADSRDLHGCWSGPGKELPAVTVLEGLRKALPTTRITHVQGVDPLGEDTSGIADAVAAAENSEVTVVVVGEPSELSGEANCRSDISLPGAQAELIKAIAATGKPFAVVLVSGRPLVLSDWLEQAPAVLVVWHPGIEGGNAVADVLLGSVNPGGKLPVSFPRSNGQIPVYYNHENTGRPYDPDDEYTSYYLDLPHGPQFPFGHGLSYTTFTTGSPKLDKDRISVQQLKSGDSVRVSVEVTNTGPREGDEVVQIYLHDRAASIVQPVRKLRGFQRVALKPGETQEVQFDLTAEDFGFWTNDPRGEFVVEPGKVDIYAGNSSTATKKATLSIR